MKFSTRAAWPLESSAITGNKMIFRDSGDSWERDRGGSYFLTSQFFHGRRCVVCVSVAKPSMGYPGVIAVSLYTPHVLISLYFSLLIYEMEERMK